MIKTNFKNVFDLLSRNDISVEKIAVNGNFFNVEQLKVLHDFMAKEKETLDCIEVEYKYNLSRRKALIVVLEEDFFDKLSYDFTDLKKYESKAASRFVLKNIVKKDLDTPQKVHPKNPCRYFNANDMAYKKRQYKVAIAEILKTPFHFFEVEIAIETLSKILTDMNDKDC